MERERIDPWGSKIFNKYDNLYQQFGIKPIDDYIKREFSDTYFFERGIIIGHRDFESILSQIKNGGDFIIVTGFASSGEFHLGHKVIIDIYNYFRKYAKKGYFVICDIDAYVSRPDKKIPTLKKAREYAINNIANALALGVKKEDIYIQSKRDSNYYTFSYMVSKKLTFNTMKDALGHQDLGKFSACYLQISDILYPQIENGPIPTLVPVGIDQEPIIRLTRDIARKFSDQFNFILPSTIYISHLPSLVNYKEKMSKSVEGSAILLNEELSQIEKIVSNAFTGGKDTLEEQRKLGGRPEICPVFALYRFHHPDSRFVEEIYEKCRSGKLICGEDKRIAKEFIIKILEEHKRKYEKFLDVARKMVE